MPSLSTKHNIMIEDAQRFEKPCEQYALDQQEVADGENLFLVGLIGEPRAPGALMLAIWHHKERGSYRVVTIDGSSATRWDTASQHFTQTADYDKTAIYLRREVQDSEAEDVQELVGIVLCAKVVFYHEREIDVRDEDGNLILDEAGNPTIKKIRSLETGGAIGDFVGSMDTLPVPQPVTSEYSSTAV